MVGRFSLPPDRSCPRSNANNAIQKPDTFASSEASEITDGFARKQPNAFDLAPSGVRHGYHATGCAALI
jgi:hypothetical protein